MHVADLSLEAGLSLEWHRYAQAIGYFRLRYGATPEMSQADPVSHAAAEMTARLTAVARHRDKAAFAELFQYYAPRVKAYLMRNGTEDSQAEEIAQEALIAVWRKAAMFDPAKASAGTWIFAIARNLRRDAIRRARRPEFDPTDPAFVPDAETPPDDTLEAEELRDRIAAAVKQLPADQAEVIKLSFFEDKPHSEIATTLALPLGTVKSRLRLAMRRIRSMIEPSP